MIRKLWDLPLGTRFRYLADKLCGYGPHGAGAVFVLLDKVADGLCAKWDGVDGPVAMQQLFSICEQDEMQSLEVEVFA